MSDEGSENGDGENMMTDRTKVYTRKKKVQSEGLDEEIEALRDLIRDLLGHKSEYTHQSAKTKLLNSISRAMGSLAKLLQAKKELKLADGDPGVMLREALQELEDEWPEFRNLVQKYYPNQKDAGKHDEIQDAT